MAPGDALVIFGAALLLSAVVLSRTAEPDAVPVDCTGRAVTGGALALAGTLALLVSAAVLSLPALGIAT